MVKSFECENKLYKLEEFSNLNNDDDNNINFVSSYD